MGLWRTDGTISGTTEFWVSPELSWYEPPIALVTNGDRALFAVSGQNGLTDLWITDGTVDGTATVPGASWSGGVVGWYVAPVDDAWIFFRDHGIHGVEPWRTDGAMGGTSLLADIRPGPASSFNSDFGTSFARLGDELLILLTTAPTAERSGARTARLLGPHC